EDDGSVYRKYYPYPYVSNHYWSFDYGPVHIAVVDVHESSYTTGSAQHNWLQNDLATTTKEWKIVMYHMPAWSGGDHSNNTTAQTHLQPLFETYGVDLVINGHNHNYVRCEVNGVVHITTGGGGAPLDPVSSSYSGSYYKYGAGNTLSYCTIDVQGYDLIFTAVKSPENTVLESFTLHHEVPNPPDPATNPDPADLATDVSITADISWDAGTYATSHDVYFGTNPTPGAGEFMGNQTGTTYDPGLLTPDTTYYWAIDAINAIGSAAGPVWSFTTTPPDLTAPIPDPATFASIAAINSSEITMTATTGSDPSGPVEYYFENITIAGHDSGWQTSATYNDTGLSKLTEYTYTVTMRDGVGNEGGVSAEASATTPDFDPIFINFQPAASAVPAGYLVDDGSVYGDRGNGYTYGWDTLNAETRDRGVDADQRYDTLNHMQKVGNDTWEIEIPNGTYDIDIVFGDPGYSDQINHVMLEDVLLVDPDGQDNFDEHFGITVVVSDGRLTVTPNLAAPNIGVNSKICFIDINAYVPPDSDPPTPNPATFAAAPAADSETAISMTATIGSDVSGPVEYYFTCTAGGGNNSLWQTSASYTDSGLLPDTTYTYTVTMRDSYNNTGAASTPADATTDPDTDPPTPNPAAFAVPPSADSDTAISMTAATGSDISGPVQYYFDEISGNPGGTDSGWQTSASYTDSGLDPETQYTYTVQMSDSASLPNIGIVSGALSAFTLPTPVPVPPVIGQDQATAESIIVAAGLVVGVPVDYEYSSTVPVDVVISQEPPADTLVDPGSSVDIVVSLGVSPVDTPLHQIRKHPVDPRAAINPGEGPQENGAVDGCEFSKD
ncbi:MAG: hypothetical protein DRP65_12625, partial [Planctomycetota bacterium]